MLPPTNFLKFPARTDRKPRPRLRLSSRLSDSRRQSPRQGPGDDHRTPGDFDHPRRADSACRSAAARLPQCEALHGVPHCSGSQPWQFGPVHRENQDSRSDYPKLNPACRSATPGARSPCHPVRRTPESPSPPAGGPARLRLGPGGARRRPRPRSAAQ